jgi:outer membrane protein TolC
MDPEVVLPLEPSVNDYLILAASRSPSLKSAFYRWESALEKSGYAGALPNPRFSYTYFAVPVETRVGPQNQKFALRQAFPWFGTLGARKDRALEAANAAYEKFEGEKLMLFYRVKAAYYDYYYLGREIAITEENFQLLRFWESVARAKYTVGLTQHPDVIKAQVELGKLEDRLQTLQEMVGPAIARLRAVVALPDAMQFPAPRSISVREVELERDSVLSHSLAHNPDLMALDHLIERERAEVRLAGKSSWPGLMLGMDYIDTSPAAVPGVPESGKDAVMVSVGLSLPIWFGANAARRGEAKAGLLGAEHNYADARNRLVAVVERTLFQHDDALRKMRLYRDGLIPKAEQSLNANYTAYQAGELDFLNVLDSQRELLEFQLLFERSQSDLAVRRAELEMIMGRELPVPEE